MIRTIKIDVNAANPQLPLQPVSVFEGSAASLVLLNVPRSLGKRTITAVSVVVINPDSMAQAYEATREGSAYQVTIPAEAFGGSGSVENGIMISASGTNERGETVGQWILGSGNLVVMQHNGTVKPGERRTVVHYYDVAPLNPIKGDVAKINGVFSIFDGVEWQTIGGGSSGGGAIVLTTNGSKVFKDGVELTSYTALLRLVQAGGVTLMGTVGADKDALYYPLICDDNAIRFDATGTLGGDVKTKSYTVQPVNGDSIRVSEGSLVDLAKKSDIPEVVAPTSDAALSGKAADAYETGVELKGKARIVRNGSAESLKGRDFFLEIRDDGFYLGNYGVSIDQFVKIPFSDRDGILALVSQLSGITAQDFDNFLCYRGVGKIGQYVENEYGDKETFKVVDDGSSIFYKSNGLGWSYLGDQNWTVIDPTDGFKKLVELYEKNKTILFTDTAFTQKVKENANYAVVDTIENRSVKRVTISGDTAMTVILPKPTADSGVIDFEVWFDASAYMGTYPSIGYKYDATTDADVITKDGEDLAYGDGAVTIVHFTSVNGSAYTAVAASFK